MTKSKRLTQNRRKPIWIYIPKGIEPMKLLPQDLQLHAESVLYLLHRIIWGRVTKRATESGYVNLKADYLREVIDKRVLKRLIDCLVIAKLIDCDRHFIRGRKSYGYRLTNDYSQLPIVRYQLSDAKVAECIRRIRRAKYKSIRLDVHCHLRKQFQTLEIDLEFALDSLRNLETFEIVKIPALQIANKDFRFSVCRYGRVHTDLTNCHSLIRSSLTVNSQHLVSIDIKNSQPLFLSLLLINYRRSGNKILPIDRYPESTSSTYGEIDELLRKTICPFKLRTSIPHSQFTHTSNTTAKAVQEVPQGPAVEDFMATEVCPGAKAVNNELLSDDEQWFVELCEQGRLYEQLMERAEIPVRAWAKEAMFEILYGKNTLRTPAKLVFTEMFPRVAEVVRAHKRKDHRFLARLLQKIESDFVINTVCRRLMVERPEAPLFTIHDSILTTPENVPIVIANLEQEFARIGLSPRLELQDYSRKRHIADGDILMDRSKRSPE